MWPVALTVTALAAPVANAATTTYEAPRPRDWSTAVVDSTIATRPATSLVQGYTDTLFLHSVSPGRPARSATAWPPSASATASPPVRARPTAV